MIRDCYLDDSKDASQEFAYVCAGFYATRRAWEDFHKSWERQLRAEGISYFKTSEYKSLSGEFRRWKNVPPPFGQQGAELIRKRLENVVRQASGLHGVGVVVPVGEHEAVLRHQNADVIFPAKYIYHRAFELTLFKTTHQACKSSKNSIAFAHDEGPDFNGLRTIYISFKEKNPRTAKYMKGFIPLDDKYVGALQIADMFANSIQGTTVKFLNEEIREASSSDIFMFDRSKIWVWTREVGEEVLAGNLESRRMPIPESLKTAVGSRKKRE